jgi:predicted transcriptional regulator
MRNFHLPLPVDLHRRLHAAARRAHRPATVVARRAIEQYLRVSEREAIVEGIREYAASHAGTESDLDPVLEKSAIELLLGEDE